MEIKDLQGKLVAVLGYGQEGKAVAAYLIKHGIKPVLFDQRPWAEWPEDEQKAIRDLQINFIFGPDCFKELAGFEVAFRSPGIPLSTLNPQPSTLITSQTKWFFEHCSCKIIGVTGTKGKGTTSTLIYEMLSLSLRGSASRLDSRQAMQADRSNLFKGLPRRPSDALGTPRNDKQAVYLTGNIGKVQPLDIIDDLKPEDWVVYELSSFQLQDLNKSPHIAVVLMITSEHLDYHADVDEYQKAKEAVTKYQAPEDFAVINADFPASLQVGGLGRGKKLYFSAKNPSLNFDGRQNQDNKNLSLDACVSKDCIVIPDSDFNLRISELQLKGAHNLQNICAAVLAAHTAGCDSPSIKKAATNFKGLEHRLEFAGEKQGIKFYNDSFSTTPETAIAAISSFAEPLILILGGSPKNSDFTELGKTINEAKNIKAIILIGEEATRIKSAIDETLTPRLRQGFGGQASPSPIGRGETPKILEGAGNMKEIFSRVKSISQKGDVVLLSPACASFDIFKNYIDRGEQFKEAVKNF